MSIISFTKVDLPYGWLGNMAPFPIEFNGVIWKTSEALFQSLRFNNEELKELIRTQASPMAAKMKAKANKCFYAIQPMSNEDVQNMQLCLKLKFTQHQSLKQKLIKTNGHIIIEDIGTRRGERHQFWGAYKTFDNGWVGKNKMGELLMELRSELKN